MENGVIKTLFVILGLFAFCSIFSQIYTYVNEQYKTETAMIYSSADTVTFKGVYIRDESVIKKYYTGVMSYPVSDGSKVANGSVIAYVYADESDIELNRRIEELNNEIELLESAQNPGTVLTAQPDFIASLIGEEYRTVTTMIAKKDLSDLKKHRDKLLTLMSIYQIAVNQEDGYDDRITQLQAEVADLERQRKNYTATVKSPDSGYFVSYTDGYENILKVDNVSNVTAELIKDVIANERQMREERSANEIGKLVNGYNWKIAGIIDNSDSVYNAGDEVKLTFASTPDNITAVIESLQPTENENEWVVILRCEEMTYDLVQTRVERVSMTLNDFEGIRVPREAIRFNQNNEKGCYVLWGQRVLFKKIDPIYEDDTFILSRITSDEDYVCVYDDVIIEGVDTAAYIAAQGGITENDDDEEEENEIYSVTSASESTEAAASEPDVTDTGTETDPDDGEGEDQHE